MSSSQNLIIREKAGAVYIIRPRGPLQHVACPSDAMLDQAAGYYRISGTFITEEKEPLISPGQESFAGNVNNRPCKKKRMLISDFKNFFYKI